MFVTSKDYGDFVADFSKKAKNNDNAIEALMLTAYWNMASCSHMEFKGTDDPRDYAIKTTESMRTQVEALLEVAQKRLKEKGIEIPKVEETSYLFKNRLGEFSTWVKEEAKLFATMKAFQSLKPSVIVGGEIDKIEQWRMGKDFEMDLHHGKDTVRFLETPFVDVMYRNNGPMFINTNYSLKDVRMPMSDADKERIIREKESSGLYMEGYDAPKATKAEKSTGTKKSITPLTKNAFDILRKKMGKNSSGI